MRAIVIFLVGTIVFALTATGMRPGEELGFAFLSYGFVWLMARIFFRPKPKVAMASSGGGGSGITVGKVVGVGVLAFITYWVFAIGFMGFIASNMR